MKNALNIQKHIDGKLQLNPTKSVGNIGHWERKTLNLHRAIVTYEADEILLSLAQIENIFREHIRTHCKRSWWRGLGFGAIVRVQDLEIINQELEDIIDFEENRFGTFQWIIIIAEKQNKIYAMHTIVKGYLTEIFFSILNNLKEIGYAYAK